VIDHAPFGFTQKKEKEKLYDLGNPIRLYRRNLGHHHDQNDLD
jgi:hypothetical protein